MQFRRYFAAYIVGWFALCFLAGGVGLFLYYWVNTIGMAQTTARVDSRNWQFVDKPRTSKGSGLVGYVLNLQYTFEVDGKAHTNSKVVPGTIRPERPDGSDRSLPEFSEGAQIKVIYDRADPKRHYPDFVLSENTTTAYVFMGLGFITSLVAALQAFRSRRRAAVDAD